MARAVVTASIDAPWGPILLAATEQGLTALDHQTTPGEFEAGLRRRFGIEPVALATFRVDGGTTTNDGLHAATHLRAAIEALGRFADGDLGALDGLPVDLADRSAWDRQVLGAVRGIPPGTTASYGQVARMIGKPGAARAVGAAVARCPIGLVVPCHRVIAGDGSLGGYGGSWWGGRMAGLELKQALLAREGIEIPLRSPER